MKVFICSMTKYPRGGATANYIQYLASAFVALGYQTTVVAIINKDETVNNSKYKGAEIIEPILYTEKRGLRHFVFWHILGVENSFYMTLKKCRCEAGDLVIVYSHTREIHLAALRMRKKTGCFTSTCITEWFEKSNCRTDAEFSEFSYYFNILAPKHDLLFPISEKIKNHFDDLGCRSLCLPIMADVSEFAPIEKKKEKIIFIFPANGQMKDSIGNMIYGFERLVKEEQCDMEFHVTGINDAYFENLCCDNEAKKRIILHNWLAYDQLIELYRSAHFLILARPINQMTESNFPSKVPEVMGHGVVPIVSRVGDYTRLYLRDGEDSIIFEGDDPDACYQAMSKAVKLFVTNYDKVSDKARATVREKFDYHVWLSKINAAVSSLIEESNV